MRAQEISEQRSAVTRIEALLTWLGGGHARELAERHERSTHAVAGAVVVLGALLAWLVAALAVRPAVASAPVWAVVTATLVFGLLVGAVTRAIAGVPARGRSGIAGRAAVAVALGVVVGELAALVLFSGSVDRRLDERAVRTADSAPPVAQASASLQQARAARSALDGAVDQARGQLDNALVIARCEYNPTPACPQTRITGVPGRGPESRTANELLGDAQRELDGALAARDRQAPALDATVSRDEQALAEARQAVVADGGRGLGARWVAMNDLTLAAAGALVLRILTIAFFTLLYLLPLILRMWRGETTHDRHATARAEQERAELEADTAIAIKRAEVRRAAEIMWAEHQLTQTRLAIEAQAEIDREHHRRRVVEALDAPVHASSERTFEPVEEDMYLPIAAEAEAASRAVAELPAAERDVRPPVTANLPAPAEPVVAAVEHYEEPAAEVNDEHRAPLIPSIPDATKAAARWIRPLVPPFVARVIDNTTQPLRSARQVFEEVEEIAFSLKRTRKVTMNTETSEGAGPQQPPQPQSPLQGPDPAATGPGVQRIDSSRGQAAQPNYRDYGQLGGVAEPALSELSQAPADLARLAVGASGAEARRELVERQGPRELRGPEGPRQLPPAP
ncbi:hypothetical protein AO501_10730 [Mycobacterium gordonae]|uniref:DUF4407 domain-containing protein n=1 Tax=Mycobacterium gordonae TaxID=1778 RepID=A0A0Q2QYH6_MYCGO|nr:MULTISPECIES: DUF4407 domain-containing protein [Mycobacterium]KQH76950.1 hypothetical protein AO501_10730 [Mycobacterium gordonae]MDP7728221.1 DUF4407 domain-containing protein [Mycobacterium sp. TY813]